jgi:FkbM family methyltransferase
MLGKLARMLRPVMEKFPKYATAYRYSRDIFSIYKDSVDTPMGFKFSGNESMQKGLFEPEETRLVNRILDHVDEFVNVGANTGYYCCFALKNGKHVTAIEPMWANLQFLYKNILANGWENRIEVFPVALSDRKGGIVRIYGGGTGASLLKGWAGVSDKYFTPVPCTTLDRVIGTGLSGRRCFFLVDIEGAEAMMLDGASETLKMDPKPIWMVEISITEHQPCGIAINPNLLSTFQTFMNNGYEARTADKNFRPVSIIEIEQIIQSGIDTIGTHNFIFHEKGKHDYLYRQP